MAQVTQQTNQLTGPAWAGDFLNREHLMPGGAKVDAAQFLTTTGTRVTLTAGAALGATSIAVTALAAPIPTGTTLRFGASKFAYTTAAVAAGATSITVEALVTALVAGDTATYAGSGLVSIPSGTAIGRTYAERDAGNHFGPAADTDDEIYLVAFDVSDATRNNNVELYRHESVVKENFLPGWSTMVTALKTALRARYQCTMGAA